MSPILGILCSGVIFIQSNQERNMKKNSVLFFAVFLAALALSGCSGNDPGESLKVPDTPQGVTVTPDDGQLAVSWQPADRAETYEVRWGDGANLKEGITGTGYTIPGLVNNTAYSIQVRAKNASGESSWSEPKSETPKMPDSAPGAPPKPTLTPNGDKLTVTWTAVGGATKYQVFFGTSANPTTPYGSDISGLSVEITLPGNGTYHVRLKAGNSKGYSEYGPGESVTVSNVPTVLGSWKRDSSSSRTYTFGENGKLTLEYSGEGTNYYYYDSAVREFYRGNTYGYNWSGNTLSIYGGPYSGSWTSVNNNDLIGTWTKDGGEISITAATITLDSVTYPYYTVSEGSNAYLVYKALDAEPEGRYALLSNGKLQFIQFYRSEYQRQGTGSGLVGTWKVEWSTNNYATWTFNADKTAKFENVSGGESRVNNYTSYTLSDSKITLEEVFGTLSGSTLIINGANGADFKRTGSGSGITGTWKSSVNGITIIVTITQNKLEYTQSDSKGNTGSGSMPIRISGNDIYATFEDGYKLDGNTLTIIEETTEELSRVNDYPQARRETSG
jgi:hypothetical protein